MIHLYYIVFISIFVWTYRYVDESEAKSELLSAASLECCTGILSLFFPIVDHLKYK